MNRAFDAVLVPGGGILDSETPAPWVQKRLDKAIEIAGDSYIVTLSAGTTHKSPLLDKKGFPIFESVVSANYLIQKGFAAEKILLEHHSYDTIGNAYFARTIHTEPGQLQHLAVVTSSFHMERTKKIFEWVFALSPLSVDYSLTFIATDDYGLEREALESRRQGEERRVASLEKVVQSIDTLSSLHHWLFKHHNAYAVGRTVVPTSEKEITTY